MSPNPYCSKDRCGVHLEHLHLHGEDTEFRVDTPMRDDDDGPLLLDLTMDGAMLQTERPLRTLGVGEVHAIGVVSLSVEDAMALRDFLNRVLSPEALKAKEGTA